MPDTAIAEADAGRLGVLDTVFDAPMLPVPMRFPVKAEAGRKREDNESC
jgi:hypothetical protein